MGGKASKDQENRKTSVSEVKKNPANLNTPKPSQDSQQKTTAPPVLVIQNKAGGSKQPTPQNTTHVSNVKVASKPRVPQNANNTRQLANNQGLETRHPRQISIEARAEEFQRYIRQLELDLPRAESENINTREAAARNTTPPPSRRRDYFVPQPLTKEAKLMSQSSYDVSGNRLHGAALERFKTNWYIQELNIVPNEEEFECPICCLEIDSCAGVQLHECLHCVCRICLENHIMSRSDSKVPCPCENCEQFLLEREIKSLISDEQFATFQTQCTKELQKVVVSKIKCKKEGCNWWAEMEKGKNSPQFVECLKCQSIICVNCEANHENLTCDEHKQKLKEDQSRALTDQIIQNGIDKGEMMRCPGCGIAVSKIAGCDWIKCIECNMEMCWATKQRRWGPNGKGDTSAGCKCRSKELNGQKCHPNCGNCH